MVAALVQVEALGRRVGADENQVVVLEESPLDPGARRLRIFASHGQNVTQAGRLDCPHRCVLAISIFGEHQDVGVRLPLPDATEFSHELVQLGVLLHGSLGEVHQLVQGLDHAC
jgi:hypothetical protein